MSTTEYTQPPNPGQPETPAAAATAPQRGAGPAQAAAADPTGFKPLTGAVLPDPRLKSATLAMVLSAVPGLGQIYVGYYQRGFVHALTVASIITFLANARVGNGLIPLFGLFLAFFWLYNIIDAGRRASLYNQFLAGSETIEMPSDFGSPRFGGSIFGGMLLILGGFVLLLHTHWDVSLDWIEEWWPALPMIGGVWLITRAIQERSARESR